MFLLMFQNQNLFFCCFSLLRQKVIWGQSVVKLPDSVKRKKKGVIQTVDWTSRLDEIFQENKQNYPELRYVHVDGFI